LFPKDVPPANAKSLARRSSSFTKFGRPLFDDWLRNTCIREKLHFARFRRPGAFSSVGRAPARQAGGHWFEPSNAHIDRERHPSLDERFDPAVRIVEPDPSWAGLAAAEIGRIEAGLGDVAVRVEHVGPTAVSTRPSPSSPTASSWSGWAISSSPTRSRPTSTSSPDRALTSPAIPAIGSPTSTARAPTSRRWSSARRRGHSAAERLAWDQAVSGTVTWVRRRWLPDGSRKPQSIP
jgi:hypothetical protein